MYSTTTFVIFGPNYLTLPYQAYLGAIGTDDAIGSLKRLLQPWTSNVPSPGRR